MTPEQAMSAARDYVAREIPGAVVVGLQEDDQDYLVEWDWDPPVDVIGDAVLLLNKATGDFREEASALGGEIGARMTPLVVEGEQV